MSHHQFRVSSTQKSLPVQSFFVGDETYPRMTINGDGSISRGGGAAPVEAQGSIRETFVANPLTLTNQLLADAFLNSDNSFIRQLDLAGCTQARVTGRVQTVGAAAAKVQMRFRAGAFSTTIGDYLIMGATSVEIALASAGIIDSGWIELVTAAKADDVYVAACSIGGDGAADPVIAGLVVSFR
jgi:hypothetical protein